MWSVDYVAASDDGKPLDSRKQSKASNSLSHMQKRPLLTVTPGSREPLGATPTATGTNFAVWSQHARHIELCLFDAAGDIETARIPMVRTGPVFHIHVDGITPGQRYGFRAHGDYAPSRGLRFNPDKLLIDPYALELDRPVSLDTSVFDFDGTPADGQPNRLDSGAVMAKAIVCAPVLATVAVTVPWADTVIYELSVKGFTRTLAEIPEAIRGTFAGLAHTAAIRHLKGLGVTAVELLPVQAWCGEPHLWRKGLRNAWGYNTIAFCAPDPRLAPGGWAEVRAAVEALAQAGIETLLDVVYNHSGEGDELGPTLSLRGLDNASYYRLNTDDPSLYVNDAGTGNILDSDQPAVIRLVLESLRTWRRLGGVAGFRFDLATVLGRRADGFHAHSALISAIEQDPDLRGLKLIAEPWDCGPGGYQLGAFPPAWGEWNDRYRTVMRGFWRGDGVSRGDLATRLAGSQDVFHDRQPTCSVNYITAHDGFTLADLVSYAGKHNAANGEGNRDGTDDNLSWNHGVEGPSDDPAIMAARRRDQRALLATLILSRGTPMLSMGAELGKTQDGNNNAYAQDNELGWIDWTVADADLMAFVAHLIGVRRAHPALTADRFLTGEAVGLYPDVAWRKPDGGALSPEDWNDPHGDSLVMVLSEGDDRVMLVFHRGPEEITVTLPDARDGHAWQIKLDSGDDRRAAWVQFSVRVAARSVMVVAEVPQAGTQSTGVSAEALEALSAAAGIEPDWWSLDGTRTAVIPDTKSRLLTAMGLPCATTHQAIESLYNLAEAHDRRPLPHAVVLTTGTPLAVRLSDPAGAPPPRTWLTLVDDHGETTRVRVGSDDTTVVTGRDGRRALGTRVTLPNLTTGRYRVWREDHPNIVCALTIAPRACYLPEDMASGQRSFGLTAQIYSVKRHGDQGIGDFTTLGDLAQSGAAAGAAWLGINPLHVLFDQKRDRASPYYPSDRRFLDPISLDLNRVPFGDMLAGDAGRTTIDYTGVWAAKSAALQASFKNGREDAAFRTWLASQGPSLTDFATFQALSEVQPGISWQDWPAALPSVSPERLLYHQYLQWLCEGQLGDAARRGGALRLYRDLAVGAAPDSAEGWTLRDHIAAGVSIGAPPDAFSPTGQVWGLPPFVPHRLAEDGYATLSEMFRGNMRYAGALRIDHAIGLKRQFWVPDGAEGAAGAYVRFPFADLLGQLALESVRAECLVVGEDLGTVPDGFRETMTAAGILSYRVLSFERDQERFRAPEAYPQLSLACASTHDLPPLAGWWQGVDISEREALGLISPEAAIASRAERAREKQELIEALAAAGLSVPDPGDKMSEALAVAIHAFIAKTPAVIAMIQVEDLAGETTAINLPGTNMERPNWRRCLTPTVDQLLEGPLAKAILGAVRAERSS